MFVDIGGIVDHHSMSWIEGWFLLILVVELLTITQWIEVRGDFCWYWWNCWPSLNEFRREVIFVDIGGIVDHHSMSWSETWFLLILVGIVDHHSMSWGERWFLLILVMVNNSTNINKNHVSLQLIEWWSTIPLISTKITSHLNSLSDGQQFQQYQQKSLLTWTHWVMVNNSTNINKNHLSSQYIEWNCWPSLNEFRWEVIFVDIGGIVDHH